MSTTDFSLTLNDLSEAGPISEIESTLAELFRMFPEEANPDEITIYGTIEFHYDDDTRVPYGETYATLPPTWKLERPKIHEIVMGTHTVYTGVAENMPKITLKEKILNLKELDPHFLQVVSDLVRSYYHKYFDEFLELVDPNNN